MTSENFYDILGVSKTASQDEIKKAYRQASKKYHPDLQNGKTEAEKKQAEEMFKKCSEAYDVLSDSEKRQQYDRFGRVGNGGGQPFDMGSFFQNHSDFFANFFGGGVSDFGNPFGNSSNNHSRTKTYPERGETLQIAITINIKDSIYSNEKTINYSRKIDCPHCHGSGCANKDEVSEVCNVCHGSGMETVIKQQGPMIMQQSFPCRKCHGSGEVIKNPCPECKGNKYITKKESIKIKIPFGLREGNHFVVKNYGNAGKNGGEHGDLIIIVNKVETDGLFRFRSNNSKLDLETDVYINPLEAVVGCKKEVFTPHGKVEIQIPENIKNESFIRIDSKGINGGSLYVKVIYDNFTGISKEIKEEICKILSNSNISSTEHEQIQKTKIEKF